MFVLLWQISLRGCYLDLQGSWLENMQRIKTLRNRRDEFKLSIVFSPCQPTVSLLLIFNKKWQKIHSRQQVAVKNLTPPPFFWQSVMQKIETVNYSTNYTFVAYLSDNIWHPNVHLMSMEARLGENQKYAHITSQVGRLYASNVYQPLVD